MNATAEAPERAKRLRLATHNQHERLDSRIMAAEPFAHRGNFGRFLLVQHAFHRDIDALYTNAVLDDLLPDLGGRRRLPLISQDIDDLGSEKPAYITAPEFDPSAELELPRALGWLYVAEGSNLGAAFLLKEAAKLGLSESFGARHLAAAPEGRGLHWRTFTAALDSLHYSDEQEQHVVDGAIAAFVRVRDLVEALMPVNSNAAHSAAP